MAAKKKPVAKAKKPAAAAKVKPAAAAKAKPPLPAKAPARAGKPATVNAPPARPAVARPTAPPIRLSSLSPGFSSSRPAAPPPPAPSPIDHAARLRDLWRRLETWVGAYGAPSLGLADGASERAIAAAEKTMKLKFPPDVRASLAIHAGQAADGVVFPWMPGCAPLLSLERIVERWEEEQELARKKPPKKESVEAGGKLKGGVYRTGRIPLAGPVGKDPARTFLDLDPGPAGVSGQLITMVNATDFVVIDASFTAAFERWVNVLERGLWSYDAEWHTVHPRALAPATSHPAGLFSKR